MWVSVKRDGQGWVVILSADNSKELMRSHRYQDKRSARRLEEWLMTLPEIRRLHGGE